jgi:hypothetical protein
MARNRFYNVIEYWNFLSSVAMLLINFEFWNFGSTISTRFWLERVAMFWILYRHAFCRLCKNHIWTDMWIYLGVFDSLVGRCLHGVVGKIMICTHVTWRLVNTCCPTRSAYLDQQLMIPICQSDITLLALCLRILRYKAGSCAFIFEVFLGTQYNLYVRLKKDSYVIEKDLYIRIRRLRLILYDWFFLVVVR